MPEVNDLLGLQVNVTGRGLVTRKEYVHAAGGGVGHLV